jgi:hypothetical protein
MPTVTPSGGMDSYTCDVGARRVHENIGTAWDSVDCDVGQNMPQAHATWDQGESSQRFNTTQVCAYILTNYTFSTSLT